MRPLPAKITDLANRGPIPGRPWWSVSVETPENLKALGYAPGEAPMRYVRRDGKHSITMDVRRLLGPWTMFPAEARPPAFARWSGDVIDHAAACDLAAHLDAQDPIPHPGYRAGQVWLIPWGVSWDLLVVQRTRNEQLLMPESLPGDAMLLHDPVKPSCAPWSPRA